MNYLYFPSKCCNTVFNCIMCLNYINPNKIIFIYNFLGFSGFNHVLIYYTTIFLSI